MIWDISYVWKRRVGINLRSKWRPRLVSEVPHCGVSNVRLIPALPALRLFITFFLANCCGIKWRNKLDSPSHNLDVLIVRLGCETPHRRLIHPFISANCCSILNVELGLFQIALVAAYLLYASLWAFLHFVYL